MYKILSVTIILLIAFGEVTRTSSHELSENQSKIRSKRLLYGDIVKERIPWQVALVNSTNVLLGSGSIITNLWVLTSRYCACRTDGTPRQDIGWAIAGVNDINPFINNNIENLNETSKKNHRYLIDKIECAKNNELEEAHHKLALLRVNREFLFSENINSIPVIKTLRKNIIGLKLEIRGWGADDVEENKWDYLLRRAERRVPTGERCKQLLLQINDRIPLKDWELCTDVKRWGNACMRDAGNPLTLNNYLLGVYVVTSRQKSDFNCDPRQVDIYISQYYIVEWMERTISPVKKEEVQFVVNDTQFTAYQFTADIPHQNSQPTFSGRFNITSGGVH